MLRFFTRHRRASVPALRAALIVRAAIGTLIAVMRGERRRALAWWRIARLAGRWPRTAEARLP
jgi:hypothetical protein